MLFFIEGETDDGAEFTKKIDMHIFGMWIVLNGLGRRVDQFEKRLVLHWVSDGSEEYFCNKKRNCLTANIADGLLRNDAKLYVAQGLDGASGLLVDGETDAREGREDGFALLATADTIYQVVLPSAVAGIDAEQHSAVAMGRQGKYDGIGSKQHIGCF